MSEQVRQDTREMGVIFIHSSVDDAGLTPAEFRIYGHLARRSSGDGAYPGVDSMARVCQLSKTTVIAAIRNLEFLGMIRVVRASGALSTYVITRRSEWGNTTVPSNGPVQTEERTVPSNSPEPVQIRERKEIQEGNPSKEIGGDGAFALIAEPIKNGDKRKTGDLFIDLLPNSWIASFKIADAWRGFVEMRRIINKPLTDRAVRGIVTKTNGLAVQINAPYELAVVAVLDNSTTNNWRDVFFPKELPSSSPQPKPTANLQAREIKYQEFISNHPRWKKEDLIEQAPAFSRIPAHLGSVRKEFLHYEQTGKYNNQ